MRAVQKSIHKKEKERKLDQINYEFCGLKHAKRKCPAYGKTCRKYNKKNHFANVCKTKVKSAVKCLRTSIDNDVHSETCTAVDETLQVLKSVVLNGWPESKHDCPKLIHQFWLFRDEITTQDGILYEGQTVIIPTSMRREML